MALGTSQYVRRHWVTVARANWGAAFAHAHNLNDGNDGGTPAGYTPNLVSITKAFVVDVNGLYHSIPCGVARIASVTAININVWVGENAAGAPDLASALAGKLGGAAVSIVLEIETRFAHSKEMGKLATGDETIGVPAAASIGLPLDLTGFQIPTTDIETVYVRVIGAGGSNSNDGRAATAAAGGVGPWLTLQKAFEYLMSISPLRHNVLVDVGAGNFGTALNWDLIECADGCRFWVVGNQPVATAGAAYKRLTINGAIVGLVAANEDGHLRFTPNAGDSWRDNAGAAVALADSDIGRLVRINDGAGGHVAYAMVGNVDTTVAGLGAYIDITVDAVLTGALPAWVTAVGSVWDLIDWADPSVTLVSGTVNGRNIIASTGSSSQSAGSVIEKYNCFANIYFKTGGATTYTFENCQRLAFVNCAFSSWPVSFSNCLSGSFSTNTIPQAGETFFWPAAIWLRIGFTNTTSNDAWGGGGLFVDRDVSFSAYTGVVAGLIWTRSGGRLNVSAGSMMSLSWVSLGPDTPAASILTANAATCILSYAKLETQLSASGGEIRLNDHVNWLSRSLAGANAPALATPTTHVTLPGGLMVGSRAATIIVGASAGSFYAGINSVTDLTDYVVQLSGLSHYIDEEGAHKDTFCGVNGWFVAYESFAWMEHAAGASTWQWAAKPNGVTSPDIFLDHGSICKIHPNIAINKVAADTIPGGGVYADHDSMFLHGNPDLQVPNFTWGAAGGAGMATGANGVLFAKNGSVVEVGNLKANVAANQLVLNVRYRSHVEYGSDGASYVLANNGAATEKKIGGLAAAPGHAIGALALLNDDYDVALNTREGCTERSV